MILHRIRNVVVYPTWLLHVQHITVLQYSMEDTFLFILSGSSLGILMQVSVRGIGQCSGLLKDQSRPFN